MTHFILADDGKTLIATTLEEWALWFDRAENRALSQDRLADQKGGITVRVSTVFMGVNEETLWETMVFVEDGEHPAGEYQQRWDTYEQAAEGHALVMQEVVRSWPRPEFIQELALALGVIDDGEA